MLKNGLELKNGGGFEYLDTDTQKKIQNGIQLLKRYKTELQSRMDVFLVKGSEIHLYVEKLNAYKEIIYLT